MIILVTPSFVNSDDRWITSYYPVCWGITKLFILMASLILRTYAYTYQGFLYCKQCNVHTTFNGVLNGSVGC